MFFKAFQVVLICILLSVQVVAAQVTQQKTALRYDATGSDGWIPYYFKSRSDEPKGIVPDIARAILNQAGIIGIYTDYPPKRTNYYLLNGQLDFDFVNPEWIADQSLKAKFVYSDPIVPVDEYYFSLLNTEQTRFLAQLEAHVKIPIGTIRGYYYHNENNIHRLDFASEKLLIEALQLGRVDFIISGDLPAYYWAKQSNVKIKVVKKHSSGYLRIRMRKELSEMLPRINKAIKIIKQNNRVEQITSNYLKILD